MEPSKENLTALARELRTELLHISYQAKVGHVGSALSVMDILLILYFCSLKIDPRQPHGDDRDRFLLSKGHAANALYTVLWRRGFFPKEELYTFCQNGSRLAVHPEDTTLPGVEFASGSLGHGLSVAGGLAFAAKRRPTPFRVFVLMSDAECNEGSVWEAALFAPQHKLDNLVVIIDYNKMQALGRTQEILKLDPFADKWRAFGWEASEIDGHDLAALEKNFNKVPLKRDRPTVFIAHTVLGKGISFMENKLDWHYLTMKENVYHEALREVAPLSPTSS